MTEQHEATESGCHSFFIPGFLGLGCWDVGPRCPWGWMLGLLLRILTEEFGPREKELILDQRPTLHWELGPGNAEICMARLRHFSVVFGVSETGRKASQTPLVDSTGLAAGACALYVCVEGKEVLYGFQ